VRCPLAVVLEREREREERTLGQAEAQFDVGPSWATYDVEVDTSVLTPDEAAARITGALEAVRGQGRTGLGHVDRDRQAAGAALDRLLDRS
jgi:hypothetical protein